MNRSNAQRGFSFIGLLLTLAIIGVLFALSFNSYKPALQSFDQGMGSQPSFRLNISRNQMKQLHTAEIMYFQIHRSYATWEQLIADGQIPRGYSNRAQGSGTPYIPYHDINVQISNTGFVITATPNTAAGASEGSPILRIDQSGNLEEVTEE